jgi:hypothetical protein
VPDVAQHPGQHRVRLLELAHLCLQLQQLQLRRVRLLLCLLCCCAVLNLPLLCLHELALHQAKLLEEEHRQA